MRNPDLMDKVVSLCKRRGFIFPGSEIYGGLANTWDFGPLGVELKNNIKQLWWKRFVHCRDDIVGLETALLMSPRVWEASGHLKEFVDPLIECVKCHERFRLDQSDEVQVNPDGHTWTHKNSVCGYQQNQFKPRQFNLMLKTFLGPVEDKTNLVYFRPETAQGMFVNFKNVLDTTRLELPFGLAQVGKAFRNEITPSNFIFRTREFEQMEIEYFIPPPETDKNWQKYFDNWRQEMRLWIEDIGINFNHIEEIEVPESERAHYSKRTIDFFYDFPFGKNELYGLAYRTDFDLRNHEKHSGVNLKYRDSETGKEYWPHVIEPTWGVERSVLAVLLEAYNEEGQGNVKRIILKLKPSLAPYKVAVFPLLANKPKLTELAREIYADLKRNFSAIWDDRGNIGKRYYSQDEIGTPYCITVDFQSLDDQTVTIRDRDTTKQDRVAIKEINSFIKEKLKLD